MDKTNLYATNLIDKTLHPCLIHLLWTMYFDMKVEVKSCLQIFLLKKDGIKQIITHEQGEPKYKRTYEVVFPNIEPIEEKVYIIKENENKVMMFSHER